MENVSPVPLSRNPISCSLDGFRCQRKSSSGHDVEVFGEGCGEEPFYKKVLPTNSPWR